MGVQRLARASTGNALTEMETEVAIKKGYLVPWQKSALENRKTWYELQLYDKGGLIYQPDISRGVPTRSFSRLMRIASSGQASTQKPQYTQRRRSISNRVGYFSIFFSGRSPASM